MRWIPVLTAAAALAGWSAPLRAQSTGNGASPPLATRHAEFSIPFRLDPRAVRNGGIVEVQLYVSDDAGATWRLVGRVEPAATAIPFRASKEGLYWFVLHTVRHGQPVEAPPTDRPGLRVLVDTTPPVLQLEAGQNSNGEVWARWTIEEANLDSDTFVLQYRTSPDQPWQSVPLNRQALAQPGQGHAGQATWWPMTSFQRLEIRAEVSDTAGNRAVAHAQVGRAAESSSDGVAGRGTRPAGWRPAGPTADVPAADPAAGQTRPDTSPSGPAGRRGAPAEGAWPSSSAQGPGPRATTVAMTRAGANETDRPQPESPVAIQFGGGKSGPSATSASAREGAKADSWGPLPPGVRPRMINSRRFELTYEVESVGPSGIGQLELWGTRDGGRTWSSFGVDEDRLSPLLVTVNEEGIFGFRVVVTSGAGLGGDPPKSGERPDIWIGVDLTKPVCRIVSAEPSPAHPGQLCIRWEAADMALADRPVSLFYSSSADGPWTPIAVELENTGQYAWAVDGRPPDTVYLRLEVRDAAGNLGIYETREPVSLDLLRPAVRIRDVRPFH